MTNKYTEREQSAWKTAITTNLALSTHTNLIDYLKQLQASLLHLPYLLPNFLCVRILPLGNRLPKPLEFILILSYILLGLIYDTLGDVSSLDGTLALRVRLGKLLGLVDHVFDFGGRQAGRGDYAHGLIAARSLILGRDVDNTVGINVERDLDLGDTLGSGDDTRLSELLEVVDSRTYQLEVGE
ncbi:NAD-specific glutamate dehydrogenase-domain-containing protein [Endogone sp. FLAS-F59071]|nr:NAD-specific glutamate dehydrogenase-domain-containing protein [Endogone sp. FLAS-F59071]|eukprot:RUS17750.1 NAD-specific glutamate dehydrogenase-domain-containing protein [Endogone sp. FLAS-F59071]